MIQKRILVPERVRRPPASGWSWIDRRFLREHAAGLSREAVLLYFFLAAVGDRHGLSFYSDGSTATQLRLPLPVVAQARDELIEHDLVAYESPLTQVLSVPASTLRRRREPGQGLLQFGELLRQMAMPPDNASAANASRSLP